VAQGSDDSDLKAELAAISSMVATLEPLSAATRVNVIDYVFKRLGITLPTGSSGSGALSPAADRVGRPATGASAPTEQYATGSPRALGPIVDLLTLKEQKQPANTNEMVALVAYYLAHEAAPSDRRDKITADDITRCFREARYPLPAVPNMALTHAKNAGYLSSTDRGQYRLSAVGHNLVAHRMGAGREQTRARANRRSPPPKTAKGKRKKGR
jgi:hypothetical protein